MRKMLVEISTSSKGGGEGRGNCLILQTSSSSLKNDLIEQNRFDKEVPADWSSLY
jgi:hypothetical protein